MRKLKTYIANSVWLRDVPEKHLSSNRGRQFAILVRASSQKEVAELIGGNTSLNQLREFNGIHEAPETVGYSERQRLVSSIVVKDRTVYYEAREVSDISLRGWYEYHPKRPNLATAPQPAATPP